MLESPGAAQVSVAAPVGELSGSQTLSAESESEGEGQGNLLFN